MFFIWDIFHFKDTAWGGGGGGGGSSQFNIHQCFLIDHFFLLSQFCTSVFIYFACLENLCHSDTGPLSATPVTKNNQTLYIAGLVLNCPSCKNIFSRYKLLNIRIYSGTFHGPLPDTW